MKRAYLLLLLPFLIAALLTGCPEEIIDDRVILTAGENVEVGLTAASAEVTFTGAEGLALVGRDFTLTGGGSVDSVTVADDIATVKVNLAGNTPADPRIYTVGISPASPRITGNAQVTITQPARATLTAGSDINVAANTLYTSVTFTGAEGLSLTRADFAVDGGGSIYSVTQSGGTVTVTVSMSPNDDETIPKVYIVDASNESLLIQSGAGVNITQGIKRALTAGSGTDSAARSTSATVSFTGASGLVLGPNDFYITGGTSTYIGRVTIAGETATVTVHFTENTGPDPINYTVSISQTSPRVTGGESVIVSQAALQTLTAGSIVNIAASDTMGVAVFTGATGLTLQNSDFAVAGTGASITGVSVSGDTASVTVTLPDANTNPIIARNFLVSVSSSSPRIRATTTTIVSQASLGGIPPDKFFFEDFGTTDEADLAWTTEVGTSVTPVGAITQTLGDGTGFYRGEGSGERGLALNFKPENIITGSKVYVDFDWVPIANNPSGAGPGYISINSNNGLWNEGNKILTFVVYRAGNTNFQLFYRLDNFSLFLDRGMNPNNGSIEHPAELFTRVTLAGNLTNLVNVWLSVRTIIDFDAGTVSFTIYNRTSGALLATVSNQPLNADVISANQVGALRLENSRADGNGWNQRLDNVFVADGPMPY